MSCLCNHELAALRAYGDFGMNGLVLVSADSGRVWFLQHISMGLCEQQAKCESLQIADASTSQSSQVRGN